MDKIENSYIGIIGLGYVGLPLAVEFAKKYRVIGFDINSERVSSLNEGVDATLEVSSELLDSVITKDSDRTGLTITCDKNQLLDCNVYIITVPTPIDKYNRPDLTPLYKASETVGNVLKKEDVVIYESTVYPGVTEEECVPVLEKESGLTFNTDFFAGYSPERINPGDKERTITKILKVTSGSTRKAAEFVDALYNSVIIAGTHMAPSIKVAEAAKVIENSQRDINIAYVNELAKIFNRMGISTHDVLKAAGTKWNFLNFKPGLVGGHCIGVDPYYLAQKAQELGYNPEIILAGRRVNDSIGSYVADQVIKLMVKQDIQVRNASILVLGFTFKENCPDVRNTRVIDIVKELYSYHVNVVIHDPWADVEEVDREYGENVIDQIKDEQFDAIILAVAHREFKELDYLKLRKPDSIIYDVKGVLPDSIADGRL